MAYDFSKNKVSVSELNQKRADAVAASRSSNSSNNSSNTPAATPTATQSDTWNKDTVTLEEARQQTEDVRRGVINPNTGSTSIELSESKETISLEQAQQQTKTEVRPATDMRKTKTTEYVNDAGDVVATKVENTAYVPIKAGSNVRQSGETVTTVQKTGDLAAIEYVDNGTPYIPEKVPIADNYVAPYSPSPIKPEYLKQNEPGVTVTDPVHKITDSGSAIVSKISGFTDTVEDKFNNSSVGKTDQKILDAIGIDRSPAELSQTAIGAMYPSLKSNVQKGARASAIVVGSAAAYGALAGATNGALGNADPVINTKEYGVTGYWKESAFAAAEGVRVAGESMVDEASNAAKGFIKDAAPYNPQLNVINTGMKVYDASVNVVDKNRETIDSSLDSLKDDATKHNIPLVNLGASIVKAGLPERHADEVGASFVKGAVVDTTAMAIAIVPSIPFYAESAIKDPTGRTIDTSTGVGVALGSAVYQAKEDPARLAGMVVGIGAAEMIGKTAGIKLYDRARTVRKTEVPIENLVTPDTLKGDGIYRVPAGTTTPQVMEMFKNTEAKYPGGALPKHESIGSENLWGFHASSKPFKDNKVVVVRAEATRPGDDFGLFVSPENANIYFTRAESKFELFGKARDPDAGMRPTLNFVQIQKVNRLPEAVRYDVGEARVFEVPESMKGDATRTFGRDLQGRDVRKIAPRKYNFEEKYGYGKPSDMSKFNDKQIKAWQKQPEEIGWKSQPTTYKGKTAYPSETYATAKMETGLARGASVEPEAGITPGTTLIKNKSLSKYYTNYKGRRVTIDVMESIPNGSKIVTEGGGRKLVDMPGNKMKENAARDPQLIKEYKPSRRALITERTLRDASIVNLYDKRRSGVMGIGYAASQEKYKPSSSGYMPKYSKYTPKTDNYNPKTSGYTPKSNNYIPKTDNYLPKTDNYIPKTSGYTPKTYNYTPKESDKFLIPAIDKPRGKARKSKDGRFKSKYDRLYNNYGDISKWRGF